MKSALAIFLTFLLGGMSRASDLEYGADGLSHLVERADVIIRAASGTKLASEDSRFVVYSVKIAAVLRGEVASGGPVVVRIPAGFDIDSADQLKDSMLFLTTRRSSPDAQNPQSASSTEEYLAIGGRYGVINVSTDSAPGRERRIETYLHISKTDEQLAWTTDSIASADRFLERSALLDLTKRGRWSGEAIVQLVKDAVEGGKVEQENLPVAVDALQGSGSPAALGVLKDMAETATIQPFVRDSALQAMPALPGGVEMLKAISSSEGMAKDRAGYFLREAGIAQVEILNGTLSKDLISQLDSKDNGVRLEALDKLIRATPSPEVLEAYRHLLKVGSWTGPTANLSIVEDLATFSDPSAAMLLKDVAADKSQSDLVRKRAIVNIGKFEAGISGPILHGLAAQLPSEKLKALALATADH